MEQISPIDVILPKNIQDVVRNFPTNSCILESESYLKIVYHYLSKCKNFLEIGYRKGLMVEICKHLGILSVHVDIDDRLLRAKPTENNKCITSDSLSFLEKCNQQFDLIFQDGSKEQYVRMKEYELIFSKNIISLPGIILSDDLHYKGCMTAFRKICKKRKLKHYFVDVKEKSRYTMGIMFV